MRGESWREGEEEREREGDRGRERAIGRGRKRDRGRDIDIYLEEKIGSEGGERLGKGILIKSRHVEYAPPFSHQTNR